MFSSFNRMMRIHLERDAAMDGIKIFFGLIVFIGFLALEWIFSAGGTAALSWIPWASLAALWWMGRLPLGARTAYGALAGFFLDALLVRPFGASIALFLMMAGAMEPLHAVLLRHDSRTAKSVHAALVLFLFFALLPVAESAVRHL